VTGSRVADDGRVVQPGVAWVRWTGGGRDRLGGWSWCAARDAVCCLVLRARKRAWRWGRSCGLGTVASSTPVRFGFPRAASRAASSWPLMRKARRRWPRRRVRRTAPGCLSTAVTARRWPRSARRSSSTRRRSTWRRGSGWCAPGYRGAARTAAGRRCGGWKPPTGRWPRWWITCGASASSGWCRSPPAITGVSGCAAWRPVVFPA